MDEKDSQLKYLLKVFEIEKKMPHTFDQSNFTLSQLLWATENCKSKKSSLNEIKMILLWSKILLNFLNVETVTHEN